MIKKITLSIFILLFFCFKNFSQTVLSNDKEEIQSWIPVSITKEDVKTESWQKIQDGVEIFFKLSTCNGEDVILLKFINHNASAVSIEWNEAVFTNSSKWIRSKNITDKRLLKINVSTPVEGACSGENYPQLVTKINDLVDIKNDFQSYGATFFKVRFIKK